MNDDLDTLISQLSSNSYGKAAPIETIMDELSGGFVPTQKIVIPKSETKLTEEDLGKYMFEKAGQLIDVSLDSIQELKDYIVQGQNPDEIAALASLISSTTGAIETLNKLHLMKKKHEMTKEIKAIDYDNKKELVKSLPSMTNNITNNQTNVLVASREEILKEMLKMRDEKPELKEIEITSIEIVDEEEE